MKRSTSFFRSKGARYAVEKAHVTDEVRNKWKDELSTITRDDIGPITSANALTEYEVDQIKKMLQQGYSLSEIHQETGHAEGTVLRYKKKLTVSGVKLGKTFEPYERKEIPYEIDTDIQFLTNRYGVIALDSSPFDDGKGDRYGSYADSGMAPDQLLMLKEEEASRGDDFFPFIMSWIQSLQPREREAAEKIMFSDGAPDVELLMVRLEAFKVYKQEPKETLISCGAWPAPPQKDTWDDYSPHGKRPAWVKPLKWARWLESDMKPELPEPKTRKLRQWKLEQDLKKIA